MFIRNNIKLTNSLILLYKYYYSSFSLVLRSTNNRHTFYLFELVCTYKELLHLKNFPKKLMKLSDYVTYFRSSMIHSIMSSNDTLAEIECL